MNKLLLLSAVVSLSSVCAQAFDEGYYYYLSTGFEGDERVLDIVNDGKTNSKPVMADKEDVSGQYWIWNDADRHSRFLLLAPTKEVSGQHWKFTKTEISAK